MTEIELKFEIMNEPDLLLSNLQTSYKLGKYKLGEKEVFHQHLIYFDTPDSKILENKGCLRLKKLPDGEEVISIKYVENKDNEAESYLDREEIEGTVDKEQLKNIHSLLQKVEITLPTWDANSVDKYSSTIELIESWGLEKLFEAKKRRIDRTVSIGDQEVAILSIDYMTYILKNKTIDYQEVEVEQSKGDISHLLEFSKFLKEKYGDWIKASKTSKFERGVMFNLRES